MSGGPDSLALLLLAHGAYPDRVEAATVDHGLRSESADEAAMVGRVCAAIGVPHQALPIEVPPGNIQSQARGARYAALANWINAQSLDCLVTAHHADDQAETLLMRLNRGSGLAGLASIREISSVPGTELPLLRPLLGWRKAELVEVVQDCGIDAVGDPSNEDEQFDRARIRKALERADWLDTDAFATSAAWLAEADDAVNFFVGREWDRRVDASPDVLRYEPDPDAPRELHRRVLQRAIGELGGSPRGAQIAELLDSLEQGKGGNLAGVLVESKGGEWLLRREPPRR